MDDLLKVIDSLVEEREDIVGVEKFSRAEEIDWTFNSVQKREVSCSVAKVAGKVAAKSELTGRLANYDSQ